MNHFKNLLLDSKRPLLNVALIGILALTIASCKKKDDDPAPTKTYDEVTFVSGTLGITTNGQDFSLITLKEGWVDKTGTLFFEINGDDNTTLAMEMPKVDEAGDYDVIYVYWNDSRGDFEKEINVVDGFSVELIDNDTGVMTGKIKYSSDDLTMTGTITLKK